jgi:hypothetical protein
MLLYPVCVKEVLVLDVPAGATDGLCIWWLASAVLLIGGG